jgi:hypothetical protein
MGLADVNHGAAVAFGRGIFSCWGYSGYDTGTNGIRRTKCQVAERGTKRDLDPSLDATVKQMTFFDRNTEHFLKAKGLCTELHFIGTMRLGLSPFVLDGNNPDRMFTAPRLIIRVVEFHDIALASQAVGF